MIYRYVAQYSDGVLRPVIPVLIHSPLGIRRVDMLIDSGADVSVIGRRVAERLRINLGTGQMEDFDLADGSRASAILVNLDTTIAGLNVRLPIAVVDDA